ncbi:MAG: glycerol-3-phosphate 1-O-acyltransferase PlsY [Deltaproteobacteria bacterium]|jgi:glycerol-3-phosphate acyltransferase PlsY|nr:glycerol-3-phosphate 1-O-acyltransferase PlsY [Deltaproteobacteria bacterium]
MNTLLFIFILIVIYLIAAIPTGIVLAKVMGYEDVRKKGSGNIGATNVYRVAGKLAGILTLAGDILKGFLPLLACKTWLAPTSAQLGIACAMAIVGHCYPVYLKFRGGKGIATALGIFLVMSPIAVIGAAIVFGITVATTRFISLGSVLAAMSAPLLVLMLNQPQPIFLATLFIATLIVWRHRSNIKRLMDGSEDRFKA